MTKGTVVSIGINDVMSSHNMVFDLQQGRYRQNTMTHVNQNLFSFLHTYLIFVQNLTTDSMKSNIVDLFISICKQ
jgi:hypothetical protein